MKRVWLITVFMMAQTACFGRDTAYHALRVIGGGDNQAILNHVMEVKGTKGEPQPATWFITVDDPNARGGVRELEVSGGRIVSEHAPVRAYAGSGANAMMDFKRLNLDSEGAFNIANQEASKRHTGFDSVDYVLRGDEQTNAPVWVLKLIDSNKVNVGTIFIAADTGAVIRTEGFANSRADSQQTPPPVRDTYVPPDTSAPQNPGQAANDNDDQPSGKGPGYKINKGLHQFGADLQQFFTGKRTWDEKFQGDQQQQQQQ